MDRRPLALFNDRAGKIKLRTYKPNSVWCSRHHCNHFSSPAFARGIQRPTRPAGHPVKDGHERTAHNSGTYLVLLRVGFVRSQHCWWVGELLPSRPGLSAAPRSRARTRDAFSPLPRSVHQWTRRDGMFSVTLSVTAGFRQRYPSVRRYPVLWSSDFPPRRRPPDDDGAIAQCAADDDFPWLTGIRMHGRLSVIRSCGELHLELLSSVDSLIRQLVCITISFTCHVNDFEGE